MSVHLGLGCSFPSALLLGSSVSTPVDINPSVKEVYEVATKLQVALFLLSCFTVVGALLYYASLYNQAAKELSPPSTPPRLSVVEDPVAYIQQYDPKETLSFDCDEVQRRLAGKGYNSNGFIDDATMQRIDGLLPEKNSVYGIVVAMTGDNSSPTDRGLDAGLIDRETILIPQNLDQQGEVVLPSTADLPFKFSIRGVKLNLIDFSQQPKGSLTVDREITVYGEEKGKVRVEVTRRFYAEGSDLAG
jgi:hypothetical protein